MEEFCYLKKKLIPIKGTNIKSLYTEKLYLAERSREDGMAVGKKSTAFSDQSLQTLTSR